VFFLAAEFEHVMVSFEPATGGDALVRMMTRLNVGINFAGDGRPTKL
jgi:hypothetical protein